MYSMGAMGQIGTAAGLLAIFAAGSLGVAGWAGTIPIVRVLALPEWRQRRCQIDREFIGAQSLRTRVVSNHRNAVVEAQLSTPSYGEQKQGHLGRWPRFAPS